MQASVLCRLGEAQAAVYEAQSALYGYGRTWKDVREVRLYVADLLDQPWFVKRWPEVVGIDVVRKSGSWSTANVEGSVIRLASLEQWIVLHEMAHFCAPGQGHNAKFARCMLTLVRREMGFHAYGDFLTALRCTDIFRDADLTTL